MFFARSIDLCLVLLPLLLQMAQFFLMVLNTCLEFLHFQRRQDTSGTHRLRRLKRIAVGRLERLDAIPKHRDPVDHLWDPVANTRQCALLVSPAALAPKLAHLLFRERRLGRLHSLTKFPDTFHKGLVLLFVVPRP